MDWGKSCFLYFPLLLQALTLPWKLVTWTRLSCATAPLRTQVATRVWARTRTHPGRPFSTTRPRPTQSANSTALQIPSPVDCRFVIFLLFCLFVCFLFFVCLFVCFCFRWSKHSEFMFMHEICAVVFKLTLRRKSTIFSSFTETKMRKTNPRSNSPTKVSCDSNSNMFCGVFFLGQQVERCGRKTESGRGVLVQGRHYRQDDQTGFDNKQKK